MPARMIATVRRQNLKNGLVIVAPFLVAGLSLEAVLTFVYGQDHIEAAGIALATTWGLFLLVSLGRWICGRSLGGRILLDCGPYPDKGAYLAVAVVLGLLTFLQCHATSWSKVFSMDGPWIPVSSAAFFLVAAFGWLQVRDNGIMQYWGLLRWGKIASFHWAEDATLLLSRRGFLSLRVALPVPPEQKQAVDEFLTRFCSLRHAA